MTAIHPKKYRTVYDYPTADALREALLQPEETLSSSLCHGGSSNYHVASGTSGSSSAISESSSAESSSGGGAGGGAAIAAAKKKPTYDWYLEDADPETQREQSVDLEVNRLLELKSYMILDTVTNDVRAREGKHDQLAVMASRLFDNKYFATTTLVDLGRQYFLSYTFKPLERTIPRKIGFCSHAILQKDGVLVVPDTLKDDRFKDNPWVTGHYAVRFYAAAPLISKNGYHLGAFSLTGQEPRPEGITQKERDTIKDFARLAMEAIEDHRILSIQRMQLRHASQVLASAANDLLTPLTGIQLSTTLLSEDSEFTRKLEESERANMRTTTDCVECMVGICGKLRTIKEALRSDTSNPQQGRDPTRMNGDYTLAASAAGSTTLSALDSNCNPRLPDASTTTHAGSSSDVFNIGDMVERLDNVMSAIPKRVPLYVNLDPSVPSFVIGDEVTLFRAALNLLRVSLQRTTTGFVRFTVRAENPELLVVECEDTGVPPPCCDDGSAPSLPVEQSDSSWLFPDSWNSEQRETASFDNLLHLVDLLGCNLNVSHKSKNDAFRNLATTCLSFQLPLLVPKSNSNERTRKPHKSDESLVKNKPKEASSSKTRRRTALIVDDSTVIRKVLARALSKLGIETSMACDGMEGLDLMQKRIYDFVLLDFLMPVMDGLDTIRKLREWEAEHRPSLRQHVVGISAHASGKDADRGMELGMDGYKSKPLILEDLRAIAECEDVLAMVEVLDEMESAKSESEGMEDPRPQETCLIATHDAMVEKELVTNVQENGWVASSAATKKEFVEKLRSRNWDAVILDGDSLEFPLALQEFRAWEAHNRVRRQRCVFLLSSGFKPSSSGSAGISLVDLPPEVDGVLGKPATPQELERLLHTARSKSNASFFSVGDIVIR